LCIKYKMVFQLKIQILWDVTSYRLVNTYRHFRQRLRKVGCCKLHRTISLTIYQSTSHNSQKPLALHLYRCECLFCIKRNKIWALESEHSFKMSVKKQCNMSLFLNFITNIKIFIHYIAFGFKRIADSIRASRFSNCPEDGDRITRNTVKLKSKYK
jgi:hypothetical protein